MSKEKDIRSFLYSYQSANTKKIRNKKGRPELYERPILFA